MELSEGNALRLELSLDGGETKSMDSQKLGAFVNFNMDIDVWCVNEVHGHLDGPSSQCASLIVLRFNLNSQTSGRRFKAFHPLITVHNSPRIRDAAKEPWITDCIEPGLAKVHISEITAKRSKKTSRGAALKISPPDPVPVSGDVSWARVDTEEWTEKYRYTVQAGLREEIPGARAGTCKNDQIYWSAEQGKLIRSGIDIVKVAFVVCRTPGYDLELKLQLDADVGFRYRARKGWANFLGLRGSTIVSTLKVYEGGLPGDIQRKLKDTIIPAGIERDYLRKLEGDSRPAFQKLAGVHDIEAIEPMKFYGQGATSSHAQATETGDDGKKEDEGEEDEEDDDDDDEEEEEDEGEEIYYDMRS